MARFKFNLDGVLRQRKLVEEAKQRAFAEVQRRYAELEAELRAMDDAVRQATEDLRKNHLVGSIDVDFLAAHRRFTIGMQDKAIRHAEKMAPVRADLEAARAALVEAAKQRKILEKLRERKQAEWATAEARKDAAAMDEIGQQIGTRLVRSAVADADIDTPCVHDADSDLSAVDDAHSIRGIAFAADASLASEADVEAEQ
jgi:flagellar FliJ protein